MSGGRYYHGPRRRRADPIEDLRAEVDQLRRERPDEATGRHSIPPPEPDEPDPFLVKTARLFWVIGGAVLTIVVGTIATVSWLDARIKANVEPIERRLGHIEEVLEKLVDEGGR